MRNKNFVFFVLLLLVISKEIRSQDVELGGWVGTSFYFGDLNTNFNLTNPGIAGGINFRLLFNDRIAYKSVLSYGHISASDANSSNSFEKKRNLSFKSPVVDFTNQIEFNFAPYVHGTSDFFTPYLSAGLSIFYYDPKTEFGGKTYNLRELGTEGQALGEEYFQFSGGIITGAGMKWDITHKLSMNFEISYRFSFTDYLDDVSTVYPNEGELRSLRGDIAVDLSDRSNIPGFGTQGQQRGNSRDKDKFAFIGLSLMYYFGSLECPPVNRYQF